MLMNYVALEPDTPTRMHFSDDYYVDRDITDRETKKAKRIRSLVFWVDRLEDEPVARTFSVISEKLRAELEPFLTDKGYRDLDFIITKRGAGFLTEYDVRTVPVGQPI
uniref:Uncharacterized protein n=1 Tax=viral metagenome TaxID=1070528 RepID=A0A6H1ZZL7_9ZZZZ